MNDPIKELLHDHRDLNGLLLAVHEALARIESGASSLDDELHEIRDGIEAFREALLEHFAREQEGLLPFVVDRLPDIGRRAAGLVEEHDTIAKTLTALVATLSAADDRERDSGPREARSPTASPLGAFRVSLATFEEVYAAHSGSELAFLDDVAKALSVDTSATAQLRALLDES